MHTVLMLFKVKLMGQFPMEEKSTGKGPQCKNTAIFKSTPVLTYKDILDRTHKTESLVA